MKLMLKKIMMIICFVFVSTSAYAENVTLQWGANTEPFLDGYIIFWDEETKCPDNKSKCDNPIGEYKERIPVPLPDFTDSLNPEYTIENLDKTKSYYFAVKAYTNEDPYEETGYSNQVYARGELKKPTLFRAFWQKLSAWFKKVKVRWS